MDWDEVRVNMAIIIGIAVFLLVFIPRRMKTVRIKKIIKNGKANKTFITAIRKDGKIRRNLEAGRDTYYATYEYTVGGKKKTYRFYQEEGYPPTTLAFYYDKDPTDVHPENELWQRGVTFGVPFLCGIAAGVAFLFLTNF